MQRYLVHPRPTNLRASSAVLFNYLGALENLLPSTAGMGFAGPLELHRAPDYPIAYAWEINAWLEGGALVLDWSYSEQLHDAPEIERILQRLRGELLDLAASDAATTEPAGRDFPLADLDQRKLSKIGALLKPNP